ncbi:MAG: hypothetical protein RIC36_18840 [Rhodospirillales bacterium]
MAAEISGREMVSMFKLMIKLIVLGLLIIAYHGVTDYQPEARASGDGHLTRPDGPRNSFSVGIDMS